MDKPNASQRISLGMSDLERVLGTLASPGFELLKAATAVTVLGSSMEKQKCCSAPMSG